VRKLLGRKFSQVIAVLSSYLLSQTAVKKQGTFFWICFISKFTFSWNEWL